MNEPYRQHPHQGSSPGQYHHQHQSGPPYHPQQHPPQVPPPYADHYNQGPSSRGPPPENIAMRREAPGPLGLNNPTLPPILHNPYASISLTQAGRKYELQVVQQPRRARMCGFGDKDRRPITPPPCVKLLITDARTGKEIDCNDVDHSMFVLNVDLWSHDASGEVNLVRHTTVSPSISNSINLSYAETRPIYAPIQPHQQQQNENKSSPGSDRSQAAPYNPYPNNGPPQVASYVERPGQPPYAVYYTHGFGHDYPPPSGDQQSPPQHPYGPPQPLTGAQIHAQGRAGPPQSEYQGEQAQQQPPQSQARNQPQHTQPQGMFTRNLIGSLAASAFRLTDTDDRIGIWFVLQDLSVRTEGTFRLRFSFVNVGALPNLQLPTPGGAPGGAPTSPQANGVNTNAINTGKAPILAQCFSEVFTVYSAKKFPGVVESTPLSKCFATQGIKIPIRKDMGPSPEKGKKGGEEEDY